MLPLLVGSMNAPREEIDVSRYHFHHEAGRTAGVFDFDPHLAAAPLPRAPQFCDGSAFLNHGELMQKAFNLPPIPDVGPAPTPEPTLFVPIPTDVPLAELEEAAR